MEQALHPAYLPAGTRVGPWRLVHPLGRGVFVHSAGGVHRDVKGANVLVRTQDGRGFLVDFGSCHYQGASPLTWHPFPPGTLAYRPPEAFAHSLQLLKAGGPLLTYSAKPTDDVFALGVTAWRLVTGSYPPSPQPLDAQAPDGPGPQPAHELSAHCSVELSTLISRMLSVRPEARGSAGELAEALERTAREVGPLADVPLLLPTTDPGPVESERSSESQPESASPELMRAPAFQRTPEPEAAGATPQHFSLRGLQGRWQLWLAAGLAGAVVLGAVWLLRRAGWEESEHRHLAHHEEGRDAGSVGLGDAVLTAPVATPRASSTWSGIGMDLPAKPFPGQSRPDATGRCADKMQAPINGGCWLKLEGDPKDCRERYYVYRGKCYAPAFPPPRPATSNPADAPDAGAQ
jgi:serine/threonine-protein kinase